MFFRSILIPSLAVCAIAAPILFSESNINTRGGGPVSPDGYPAGRMGEFIANGQRFANPSQYPGQFSPQYPGQPLSTHPYAQPGQLPAQFASYGRPNPADSVNGPVYGSQPNSNGQPPFTSRNSRNLSAPAVMHSQSAPRGGLNEARNGVSGNGDYQNGAGRTVPFGLVPINTNPGDQLSSAAAAEFQNAYGLPNARENLPVATPPSFHSSGFDGLGSAGPRSANSSYHLPNGAPKNMPYSPVSSSHFAPDFTQPVSGAAAMGSSTSPPNNIMPTVPGSVSNAVLGMTSGMVPEYGAAETLVFPGNERGPDLNATPLDFVPVADFAEIFRFDITADWVKRRWKRVSTNAGDNTGDVGLRGLRVAVVTGLNSWDLHGSLTYYFDAQQRLQRITFRGWTGDPNRLLRLLSGAYEFRPQPSLLAGFYVAQNRRNPTGALLMKEPPVVSADNPTEQMALVLEINNPTSKMTLSDNIRLLIAGSVPQ
jgi:hypothetical protein